MADGINRSSVLVTLTDVNAKILRDTVELKFYNVRLASEKLRFEVNFRGNPVTLKDLPAVPNGLAQVFITRTKYRFKSIFENVASDGTSHINEVFFVDPGKVKPQFPVFSDIKTKPVWAELARLLKDSGILAATDWNEIEDQPKAGLLNLYCKMQATSLPAASGITGMVQRVTDFKPARILARVDPTLIDFVSTATDIFHTVPRALHSFDPPWKPVEPENSWKTFDAAGNLQLTFATDGKGNSLADIDLDDHQGIQHAFDVLEHTLTGKDTHPYDIHEILIFFQQLDPGYLLT